LTIRVQYQSRRRYEKTDSLCVRGYEIPRPHGGNGEKGVKSKLTKKYKNEKPSFLSFLSMTVCQKKNRQACNDSNNASGDFLLKNRFCHFTNFSWQTSVKSDKITVSQIFFSLQ
jgi:hypothetical protein